jgi:Txe/YoeB family toxin of Txe-Axe toxin-antitoxin module
MIKPSRVVFLNDKIEKSFYSLDNNDPLKKGISKAIVALRNNAFAGIQIPKRLFPKEYVKQYQINNLWKYNLPNGWRLLYTITADDEVEILSAILDWYSHKEYERRFKY